MFAKLSTAKTVLFGPVLASDGAEYTGAVVGDVKICKNDGTPAALNVSATLTHKEVGLYELALTASDISAVGVITIVLSKTTYVAAPLRFNVLPALVYDSLVGGTDNLQVDAIQVGGTTQTARDLGASVLLSPGTGAGQISLASGAVTVGTNNDKTGYTASTVSDKTGYSLADATSDAVIADAVWNALVASYGVANSYGALLETDLDATISSRSTYAGGAVASVTGAVGSVTGNVGGNVVGSVGSIATGGIVAASFAAGAIDSAAIATGAIDADALAADAGAEIADAVWDEARSGHITGGSFGEGVASVQGNVTGSAASVTGSVGSVTGNVGGNVVGAVGSVTGAVGSVNALGAQAKADVNAEVLDVLSVDTFGEPASVPPATTTFVIMLHWLYSLSRNKQTQTAETQTLRNDTDSLSIGVRGVTDNGVTLTCAEWV